MEDQLRESLVFQCDGTAKLRYKNISKGSIKLYFIGSSQELYLKEGEDFTVDYAKGILHSRNKKIKTYEQSPFCGMNRFNHEQLDRYGNYDWTYLADYTFDETNQPTDSQIAKEITKSSVKWTIRNRELNYIIFGDSISTGLEATHEKFMYFNLWIDFLKKKYSVNIHVENMAIGGETSSDGIKRFEKDVSAKHPDLVTIAYGMNDQCLKTDHSGCFVPLTVYQSNIEKMIVELQKTGCQVLLVSPCLSNPRWLYSSGVISEYAEILSQLSEKYHIPFANITKMWEEVIRRGKSYESLLSNDINHPTDYGHKLYYYVMKELMY